MHVDSEHREVVMNTSRSSQKRKDLTSKIFPRSKFVLDRADVLLALSIRFVIVLFELSLATISAAEGGE